MINTQKIGGNNKYKKMEFLNIMITLLQVKSAVVLIKILYFRTLIIIKYYKKCMFLRLKKNTVIYNNRDIIKHIINNLTKIKF